MLKLVAIDIDGTLLNSKRELTQQVKNTLQEADRQGVQVVLCTGRPLKGVLPLLEALDIVDDNHYVVTYNGSLIQTTSGSKTIASFDLNVTDFERVQQTADTLNIPYHAIDQEAIYTTNRDIGRYTVHEAELVGMPLRYRSVDEIVQKQLRFQKMMIVDEPARLDQMESLIREQLGEKFFLVKSAPYYLEVLHPRANKGSALQSLMTYLQLEAETVMAIGDNYNDIDMLQVAGISVAMGNAVEALKQLASHVTASNDEDGVAKIVDQFLNA